MKIKHLIIIGFVVFISYCHEHTSERVINGTRVIWVEKGRVSGSFESKAKVFYRMIMYPNKGTFLLASMKQWFSPVFISGAHQRLSVFLPKIKNRLAQRIKKKVNWYFVDVFPSDEKNIVTAIKIENERNEKSEKEYVYLHRIYWQLSNDDVWEIIYWELF